MDDTKCAVALGTFDGLHRGHQAVLSAALTAASAQNLCPTVLLFDRHPKDVLCGEAPPLLLTQEEKQRRLRACGFKLKTVSFSALKDLSPRTFAAYLCESLNAAVVCCGNNYRFGKAAQGTAALLKTLGAEYGFQVQIAPEAEFDGAPVSATRIREAIEHGALPAANAMLGRAFSYAMPVVVGDRRGRLLGFPTINQYFPDGFVRPRAGVYASKVCLNGIWYSCVTNIGVRPTIGTNTFHSETCILGFSGDLYGQTVEVHLLQFLRDEKKFESLEQLKAAMQNDAAAAKRILSDHETTECESSLF